MDNCSKDRSIDPIDGYWTDTLRNWHHSNLPRGKNIVSAASESAAAVSSYIPLVNTTHVLMYESTIGLLFRTRVYHTTLSVMYTIKRFTIYHTSVSSTK